PQMDGELEWVNQEVGTYLRLVCTNDPMGWVDKLPMFEWFHNSSEHSVTKASPSQLLFGYSPQLIPGVTTLLTNLFAESCLAWMSHAQKEALAALSMAQQLLRDRAAERCLHFEKGDRVWLD